MTSRHAGLKIVDDDNYIYQLDRKNSDKAYWKCEIRECGARSYYTIPKNDNISVTVITKLGYKFSTMIPFLSQFFGMSVKRTCNNMPRTVKVLRTQYKAQL